MTCHIVFSGRLLKINEFLLFNLLFKNNAYSCRTKLAIMISQYGIIPHFILYSMAATQSKIASARSAPAQPFRYRAGLSPLPRIIAAARQYQNA